MPALYEWQMASVHCSKKDERSVLGAARLEGIADMRRKIGLVTRPEAVAASDCRTGLRELPSSAGWRRAPVDLVKYNGCSITLRIQESADGTLVGSYEIAADSAAIASVFETLGIDRLHTIFDSRDPDSGIPEKLDRHWLVEMAKCEIDFLLESEF